METDDTNGNFWMGQFYEAELDKYFGCMYENEMDFHMFTRTANGFCEKCDLEPLQFSDTDGYKLPGYLFHSRAMEFKSEYFESWQSDILFTNMVQDAKINCRVFKFEDSGRSIGYVLNQRDILRMLAGTLTETEAIGDFITCKDAKVGMTIQFGTWVTIEFKMFPLWFTVHLTDPEVSLLPTHMVNGIRYGYKLLVRFACDYSEIDDLCNHLHLLSSCIMKECNPNALDELPTYKVWIGPASSLDNTSKVFTSVIPLRMAYDTIMKSIEEVLKLNRGKGFHMRRKRIELNKCVSFTFDLGDRSSELRDLLNKLPKDYLYNNNYNLTKCRPSFLLKEIVETSMNLRRCKIILSKSLKLNFETALEEFRRKLTNSLYWNDIGTNGCDFIEDTIQRFEYSRYSPKRVNQLLDVMTESENEESNKFTFTSELIRKGVKFLPNSAPTEEYVVLEFAKFKLSQFHNTWAANVEFFKSLISERQIECRKRNYYINELENSNGGIFIKHFNHAEIISHDMLGEYRSKNKESKPLFTTVCSSIQGMKSYDHINTVLGLPCPSSNQGCCAFSYNNWSCKKCQEVLKYHEAEDLVYCRCGETPFKNCLFSCSQENHDWIPFSPVVTIKDIQPRREINVLLLGESGTGKSTFINSLINCMLTDSSDVTIQAPLHVIPTAFIKQIGEAYTVSYGEDINEEIIEGRTRTLKCRSYLFPLDETRAIRFIDTPGFPSTDYVPFLASVLNQAKQFSMIHAFCFVLKSTDSNLSEAFISLFHILLNTFVPNSFKNFIFLLTHFHKSGKKIEFLENLINLWQTVQGEEIMQTTEVPNVFTIESIFPYLLEKAYQGLNTDAEIDSYQKAWESSKVACDILPKHVSDLQPIDPAVSLRYEEKFWAKLEDIYSSQAHRVNYQPVTDNSSISFST